MTAAEFRAARLSLWPRQTDAAAALGFSRQATISDLERGDAPVTPQTALLMRAYLDGWRPSENTGDAPSLKDLPGIIYNALRELDDEMKKL